MSDEKFELVDPELGKDPNAVLEASMGKFTDVLVLGWSKDGNLHAMANLGLDVPEMNYMVDLFKHEIISNKG